LGSTVPSRDAEQKAKVADLRGRFVDGPVLVVPRGRGASFLTTGATPIPGEGTVILQYRVTSEWGSLESTGGILESSDGVTLRLAMPYRVEGTTLVGDGWKITLADGWGASPGPRSGDYQLSRGAAR
jgi:predicted aconitase with swiveling domain